jgi:hypothetical protein
MGGATGAKVALTLRAALIETVHVKFEPLQTPPQAESCWPLAGVAANTTDVLTAKFAVQVAPQLIPVGADDTAPLPETATVNANVDPFDTGANVTATLRV